MEFDYFENVEEPRERWKRFEKFLETLSPELKLENLFGMNRFRWNGQELTAPTNGIKFLSMLLSTSLVVVFVISRIYIITIFGKPYEFNVFREFPVYLIFGQYWVGCILSATLHTKGNIKIMKTMHHLDTALKLNITEDYYDKERKENVILVSFLIVFHAVFQLCDVASDGVLTLSGTLHVVVYFYQDLELIMFYKLLTMLKTRLNALNDRLGKVDLKYGNSAKTVDSDEDNAAMELYDLAALYYDLGEICSSINSVFNFHVLMILTSSFAHIIVIQWVVLHSRGSNDDFTMNSVKMTIWCIRCVCAILTMCITCEKLLSLRKNTTTSVNEMIMDYDRPPQVRRLAKAFMELLEACDLKISVYDMFYVDSGLVFKFLSVSTTYLIVLIQIYHFV
ncbi:hypothetical protein EVAR_57158_1 [Eumeta japonica]|uniref:Gustatory receptor n=1 Tax=Eumeta variegata TaxID=151549 RepID=A0A4C1YTU6_EUMVA|nr:hypothetical protein EVAR_57158_1 [Eumeta japonica]